MAIDLTLTTTPIADGEIIYAANHLTPLGQVETYLENVLNGAQSAEAIRFDELVSNPATPATGKWKLYAKSTGLYIIDDGGTVIGPLGAGGGGVSDHGALTGLSDDDHSIYLPIDGSRGMTGVLIIPEIAEPSTPASGKGKVWFGTDGVIRAKNDAGTVYDLTASGAVGDYIQIEDQKTSGTSGGTCTAGSWQTRDLNTEVSDTGGHASIASNQITLAAGTYRAWISCPAYQVNLHQARLQNVTDGTTLLLGVSGTRAPTGVGNHATCNGEFTLASSKVLEVQHRSSGTQATSGLGVACSFDTEVFTRVILVKVA